MARTASIPYRPEPPPDLELSPLLDIEGKEGAADWVRDNIKWPATGRWIHDHTIAGHIRYSRALGKRWYSSLELYNFVMAQGSSAGSKSTSVTEYRNMFRCTTISNRGLRLH